MTAPIPDKPNSQVSRPWTPAPWAVDGGSSWPGRPEQARLHVAADRERDEDCMTVANQVHGEYNADLIALAPEMAEAILAWADGLEWTNGPIPEGDALKRAIAGANRADALLLALAQKLRAIGASDD